MTWVNGTFPQNDALLVGGIPEVFEKIGLPRLPMTINQSHVDYAINGKPGDATPDHVIGIKNLKDLPNKLADPIIVFSGFNKKNGIYTLTALIEMKSKSGKNVIVPIHIGKHAFINVDIDVNSLASIHGRKNAISGMLMDAFNRYNNGESSIFYLDNKKTSGIVTSAGFQMSGALRNIDGYIAKITDPNSKVKSLISSTTESRQFKAFIDGSNAVDANGNALLYKELKNKHFVQSDESGDR